MDMKSFNALTDFEDFLEFFEIENNEKLNVIKRLHILKKFGEMIAKIDTQGIEETKLLEFYRFAFLSVYKNFENGYNPSAADVWSMFDRSGGCMSCMSATMCDSLGDGYGKLDACATK